MFHVFADVKRGSFQRSSVVEPVQKQHQKIDGPLEMRGAVYPLWHQYELGGEGMEIWECVVTTKIDVRFRCIVVVVNVISSPFRL